MTTRSKHLSMLAELSASPSSSTSSLHGVNDIDGLKDVVLDLSKRLEVLEKVFVFVDFDQINQAIAKFGAQGAAGDKVGADQVLSAPPPDVLRFEATSETSTASKKTRSKSNTRSHPLHAGIASGDRHNSLESSKTACPESTGTVLSSGIASYGFEESKSNRNSMETPKPRYPATMGYLQPLTSPSMDGLPRSVGNLAERSRSGSKKDRGKLDGSISGHKGNNFSAMTGAESELLSKGPKDKLLGGINLASAMDDNEFGSTCSTWNQTFSSRSGGDLGTENDLIDPERFNKFLKQAIRPRWQMEQKKEGRAQSKAGMDDVRAGNDIDDIMGAILEEKSKPKP